MGVYTEGWARAQREILETANLVGGERGDRIKVLLNDLEQEFRAILRDRNGIISIYRDLADGMEQEDLAKTQDAIDRLKAEGLLAP